MIKRVDRGLNSILLATFLRTPRVSFVCSWVPIQKSDLSGNMEVLIVWRHQSLQVKSDIPEKRYHWQSWWRRWKRWKQEESNFCSGYHSAKLDYPVLKMRSSVETWSMSIPGCKMQKGRGGVAGLEHWSASHHHLWKRKCLSMFFLSYCFCCCCCFGSIENKMEGALNFPPHIPRSALSKSTS